MVLKLKGNITKKIGITKRLMLNVYDRNISDTLFLLISKFLPQKTFVAFYTGTMEISSTVIFKEARIIYQCNYTMAFSGRNLYLQCAT